MAKELQQTLPETRRKRVQRLKKMIIGIVAAGIVIPLLCCVYLICRLHTIGGTLKTLEQRLDELDIRNQELQTLLQQLQEQKSTPVQTPQIQEDSSGAEASEPVAEESSGQEEIHKVYLTFDDGPSIYTNDILDILDSYNVFTIFLGRLIALVTSTAMLQKNNCTTNFCFALFPPIFWLFFALSDL